MRILFALALFAADPAAAQAPPNPEAAAAARFEAQRAAMARLDMLHGVYRGTSVAYDPGEPPKRGTVLHKVGPFIGGAIKVMEGRSYDEAGKLKFNGMMVLFHDTASGEYRTRSFTMGGGGETKMTLTDDGYYFEIPMSAGAVRRVNIIVAPGKWGERVEIRRPGQEPFVTLTMDLTKVSDADWPLKPGDNAAIASR